MTLIIMVYKYSKYFKIKDKRAEAEDIAQCKGPVFNAVLTTERKGKIHQNEIPYPSLKMGKCDIVFKNMLHSDCLAYKHFKVSIN